VKSVLYLRVMLSKIACVKKVFAFQIEKGEEVYIPNEISQRDFPLNFKYYDCTLQNLMENMRQETKDFYIFKNTYRLQFYNRENFLQRFLEKLGISEPIDENGMIEPRKVTIKHDVANKRDEFEMNHHLSHHVLSLQKSEYIRIDDDMENLKKSNQIQTRAKLHEIQINTSKGVKDQSNDLS